MVVNSVVLAVLWILRDLHLFTPILMYEVVFISGLGVLQILASQIHEGKGRSYRWGKYRAYWLDLRKFAKLKPEERSRYSQEGKVRIAIGATLLIVAIILHF